MKDLIRVGKTIGIFIGYVVVLSFILALLNLIGMSQGMVNILSIILMIGVFLFIGFKFGQTADKKGYIEGIKVGISLIFILIIINLLFYRTGFTTSRIIYYFVLILSSIFGSMIGINKKEK